MPLLVKRVVPNTTVRNLGFTLAQHFCSLSINGPSTFHISSPRSLARDHIGNHRHDPGRTARMGRTGSARAHPLFPPSPDDQVESDVPAQDALGTHACGATVCQKPALALIGFCGNERNHLQSRPADLRSGPSLLPGPYADPGAPSIRERGTDDGASARVCAPRRRRLVIRPWSRH